VTLVKRLLCLAAVALGAALLASTAAADTGMTIGLGSPSLSNSRVLITEPVTVSCLPFDPFLTLVDEQLTVSVEQAAGKAIARGSGFVFGSVAGTLPFPCDGAPHTVSVNISADPAGPPFHGGPTSLSAFGNAEAGTPCFPGSTTCFFITAFEGASVGPTTLTMH
jgi:hypothetical protein